MRLIKQLRPVFLRWDAVLAIAAVVLPLVLAMLLGFLWLAERDWLVIFIGVSIALSGGVALIRFGVRRMTADKPGERQGAAANVHVAANPEWSVAEHAVFQEACAFIGKSVSETRPWEDLQPLALDVIDIVAKNSIGNRKGRLDFTAPEVLLLVERVASRFRNDLRSYIPMADTLSVATLERIWRHKNTLQSAVKTGKIAWRAARAIKSLPIAILREIEGAIAQGHANLITGEGTATVQALLLEEVAAAAVDLYSGRLRFSDTELLELRVASGETDRERLSEDDAPVRIAIAGQISAGKSSLINALLGAELAEADVIATTDRPTTYETEWGEVPCMLLDLPGLDGSKGASETVLTELLQSDLVIWVVRANRPARDIDRQVIGRFRAFFEEHPERRAPPLIPVATGFDMLSKEWPYPENLLPADVLSEISSLVQTIGQDIGTQNPIPVVLTKPDWNVETMRAAVESQMLEALMTQRNRVRTTAARTNIKKEITRAGRGVAKGFSVFGAGRTRSGGKDRTD